LFLFPKLSKEIGYSSITISNILGSLFTLRFLSFLIFSRFSMELTEGKIFVSYLIPCFSFIITGIVKIPFLHLLSISSLGISSALSFKLVFSEIAKKGYSTELNEIIIGIGWLTGPLFIGFLSHILGISKGFISAGIFVLFVYIIQKIIFLKNELD
ncbi:MAG: hypothetical protein NZ891_06775, partial [bacterium]|nr:hypothetical protein [bacterium]MDW8164428.1 hypothetical protein [Candidatus Omnitrophota bacterium]